MAGPLTIDNYDVAVHERWAKDQESLEQVFIRESGVSAHLDIAALEKSLRSKWEELFEFNSQRHTFACFAPPPKYTLMRNRFFSHAISKQFDWGEEEEEGEEEKQQREDERQAEKYKEAIQKASKGAMPITLFERERSQLLNLIDSIRLLNGFMREIHARKLQYQKG